MKDQIQKDIDDLQGLGYEVEYRELWCPLCRAETTHVIAETWKDSIKACEHCMGWR